MRTVGLRPRGPCPSVCSGAGGGGAFAAEEAASLAALAGLLFAGLFGDLREGQEASAGRAALIAAKLADASLRAELLLLLPPSRARAAPTLSLMRAKAARAAVSSPAIAAPRSCASSRAA